MHPFGGTPICPRCSRAVYLAEQVMGPGRKVRTSLSLSLFQSYDYLLSQLYHKPCLACTICNKRLDSFTLLEHDQQVSTSHALKHHIHNNTINSHTGPSVFLPPSLADLTEIPSKSCHLKNFGTRDLRHANLPNALPPGDDTAPPASPTSPTRGAFPPPALLRPLNTGGGGASFSNYNPPHPRLKPNRSLATSPISSSFPRGPSPTSSTPQPITNGSAPDGDSIPKNDSPALNEVSIAEDEAEVHDSLILDRNGTGSIPEENEDEDEEMRDSLPDPSSSQSPYPSNTGRPGIGTIPRTIPLYLNGGVRTPYKHHTTRSVGSIPSNFSPSPAVSNPNKEAEDIPSALGATPGRSISPVFTSPGSSSFGNVAPLTQTATGTRYGIALSGGVGVHMTGTGGSPRKWGGNTPVCPRCMKSVYFAEQVKAVGKTFHKNCLRCVECNSSLDSNRLRDHDGEPVCVRCYSKLHGPQGSGYALLGKAGG
ncbi:hypothetical protein GALMADRAFT_157929 [Galerina marginata CBS 339.88]|uniref:LIM zinc-binding domain-containing protein n=1 Tax=Galerina marginata (strain CBS 339.88) TaxID=685588 RepID=A0A067STG8_GALM3|nr:hypothetical protein GALMADRAFT_157929 [Galerina marginata CBS 339.88]